ncbi:T6SS immunity protein Tdi1 domain-containing protein [Actinoplanes sp. NPDC049316]|uniref:T6SS immunity protein Tdi1 domain-containing protein n=1 Tax=Actinoplanes sp. NPDC049316 TaxID=3154727 RepID=UPI0034456584
MFERFRGVFRPDGAGSPEPFPSASGLDLPGLRELAAECSGRTFGDGMVRVHAEAGSRLSSRLITEAFPEFAAASFLAVAQDWTGRQYAVGTRPGTSHHGQVLLFEPATGDSFETDVDVPALLNEEFVSDPDTYLAGDLFAEWRSRDGRALQPHQCVGFKVPLFLGGEGSVDNLEMVDLDVYWSILGQLRNRSA